MRMMTTTVIMGKGDSRKVEPSKDSIRATNLA
jgi:hypothetical protein